MEMTSHFERLGMGAFRIVASLIGKNSNILLFTFFICRFKSVYSMDMIFHSERLGAFSIVAYSTGN